MVAAAAAKSLQSCPTLCDPLDGSPTGAHVPGIHLPKRITEGGTLPSSFYEATITLRAKPDREAHTQKQKKENDRPTPWTVALQVPLSTEFSRPEYQSGQESMMVGHAKVLAI